MREMLALLSRFEETALRKVALGDPGPPTPEHARRLLQLGLIEWNGWQWCLTPAGRRRFEGGVNTRRQH